MTELAVRVVAVRWLRPALSAVVGVALYGAILLWGGLPAPERMPFFLTSAALLLLVLAGLGVAAWLLIFKPLPPGVADLSPVGLQPGLRRAMAGLIAVSGVNIIVGSFWDEVWRRQYDISIGASVVWRPELLTYSGFALMLLLAGSGLWYLARHARGSLLQRFRAHPTAGLLVIAGAFLAYVLPAEALWRFVYGEQASGWSAPHLLRGASFVTMMLLAAAMQLSTQPVRRWNTITALRGTDLFLITTAAFIILVGLQILTVEWDAGTVAVVDHRPPWLLPMVLLLMAGFTGAFVLRSSRLVGAATVSGLLALGMRFGLMKLSGYNTISADPWIVVMPALLALDVWYFLELVDIRRAPKVPAAALAATAGLVVAGFPLINRLFLYPAITVNNFPIMAAAGFVGALGGVWLGTQAGDLLATQHKQLAGLNHMRRRIHAIPVGGLAAVLAFIAVIILTAAPPL